LRVLGGRPEAIAVEDWHSILRLHLAMYPTLSAGLLALLEV
jgi:hypothetical protein